MKILANRGNTSIASRLRLRSLARASFPVSARAESGACAASASRYLCHLGHAGNGDAMLAYHLMDFSRYFFDQGNIRH
ncbi:hypothetical protein [Herbaspirillum hiltneri]|uniref:hypothetical protein n=1 Tax=Herbaspirillum hiltneri TaxID=341045 RepID=UPI00118737F4|nr:hypothetical protein [Herbaspirillum hiltneri]